MSGGYGFTCGVEWLAPERVNVHSSRGLAWDSKDNVIAELARLNRLVNGHPCFFDGAKLTRLSSADSPVYALRRDSADGRNAVLVLANNDTGKGQPFLLTAERAVGLGKLEYELTGQPLPAVKALPDGGMKIALEPGACYCLSGQREPTGLGGEDYRRARALAAWALAALHQVLPIADIPALDWRDLARIAGAEPAGFLAACSRGTPQQVREELERLMASPARPVHYRPVVTWTLPDRRRIVPVPPGHWLLVSDSAPFRAVLQTVDGSLPPQVQSIAAGAIHLACFAPGQPAGDALLSVERYAADERLVEAQIRFLAPGPDLESGGGKPLAISNLTELRDIASAARVVKSASVAALPREQPLVLLTNGIGGMARMCVDLGAIKSKYDCLLAANLNPRVPVDRHVLAKRVRVWVNADGFISPVDLRCLASFEPGPPAMWHFIANAGDGLVRWKFSFAPACCPAATRPSCISTGPPAICKPSIRCPTNAKCV